ncbi:MAG: NERD domain-containing protein [Coriobacteriia bacterium]|nr:NERD domain-containing protein [Coriobacteriia bacterium]
MARMVPNRFEPAYTSSAEKRIFKLFAEGAPRDWVVLHSLDIAPHGDERRRGEADFVAIVPGRGVAVLEVKTYAERTKDGRWRYRRDATPETRSPFEQAATTMYSIRHFLRKKMGGRVPFVCHGVMTPFGDLVRPGSAPDQIEWNEWQAIGESALAEHRIRECVERLIDREAAAARISPNRSFEADRVVTLLRPRFEFFQSPETRRAQRDSEILFYTREQFDVLDEFEANGQLLVDGLAGTGKTLLAIEAARRAASVGSSVRVLCYNRHLATWLREQLMPLAPAVQTDTLHGWLADVAGTRDNGTEPESLADAALAVLEAEPDRHTVDVLVIDEAQDVIHLPYLRCLSSGLRDGLTSGAWLLLGDLSCQDVTLPDKDEREVLEAATGNRVFLRPLRRNCRNTRTIAAFAEHVARLPEGAGYSRVLRSLPGPEPEVHIADQRAQQVATLAAVLERLMEAGYSPGEIVVLSLCSMETSVAQELKGAAETDAGLQAIAAQLRPYTHECKRRIRFDSVRRFKGLEAPVIVLTDFCRDNLGAGPEDLIDELLYIGATRAIDRLVVICDEYISETHRLHVYVH